MKQNQLESKFEELTNALAEKEGQLSRALQKLNMRSFMHVETLAELSSTEEALKESELKRVALEESVNRLQDRDEDHQRELNEKEESLKQKIKEEHERELEKVQDMFEEELQKKEDSMREELLQRQENFKEELKQLEEKYNDNILEREECMRRQLLEQEAGHQRLLAEICQPLEAKAQQRALEMRELENQLQESIETRKRQEEKTEEEILRLSEALSHLQVRHFNICLHYMHFQPNLKHDFTFQLLLQEQKKKKTQKWWKFWKRGNR